MSSRQHLEAPDAADPELAASARTGGFERLFVHALGAPHDRGGLARAMRPVVRCLRAATKIYPAQAELAGWHTTARLESERLQALASSQTHLLIHTVSLRQQPGYGAFLEDWPVQTRDDCVERTLAVMGRTLVAFACAQSSVPPAFPNKLLAVLRAATESKGSKDLLDLAQAFPVTPAEAREAYARQTKSNLRSFISGLEKALSMSIVSPQELLKSTSNTKDRAKVSNGALKSGGDDEENEDLEDTGEHTKNVIGWLIQRANRADFVCRYSPPRVWDALTPSELVAVCGEIRRTLGADRRRSGYAVLAIVSLTSSLPARLALNLPFHPNDDLWLTPDLTRLQWNLSRVLERSSDREEGSRHLPHRTVDIVLPACLGEAGRTLGAWSSTCSTLGNWLTGSDSEHDLRDYLSGYRAWLRALRPSWLHAPYDARFAVSLAQMYREQFGDVIASLLALDFREVAIGTLHYVALPRSQLWSHSDHIYRHVELGPAASELQ